MQQKQFGIRFSAEESQKKAFFRATLSAPKEKRGVYARLWAREDCMHSMNLMHSKKFHWVPQHSSLQKVIAAVEFLSCSHLFFKCIFLLFWLLSLSIDERTMITIHSLKCFQGKKCFRGNLKSVLKKWECLPGYPFNISVVFLLLRILLAKARTQDRTQSSNLFYPPSLQVPCTFQLCCCIHEASSSQRSAGEWCPRGWFWKVKPSLPRMKQTWREGGKQEIINPFTKPLHCTSLQHFLEHHWAGRQQRDASYVCEEWQIGSTDTGQV